MGASIIRVAMQGWTYQKRSLEFETSKLSSLVNDKPDGTAWADASVKFYDASDVELTTQPTIDTDCVRTVVDWTPAHDMQLIGGEAAIKAVATNDVRMWVQAAPAYNGPVMVNGINFAVVKDDVCDGRAVKMMKYNGGIGTNTMRTTIRHTAGEKHVIMVLWEHYKE